MDISRLGSCWFPLIDQSDNHVLSDPWYQDLGCVQSVKSAQSLFLGQFSYPGIMAFTDVDELLRQLSLEEKVSLLSGVDIWHTPEVPRLGIGAIKVVHMQASSCESFFG